MLLDIFLPGSATCLLPPLSSERRCWVCLVRAFVVSGVAVWLASFMVVTTAVLRLYVPVRMELLVVGVLALLACLATVGLCLRPESCLQWREGGEKTRLHTALAVSSVHTVNCSYCLV
jgi:hypothetical protein